MPSFSFFNKKRLSIVDSAKAVDCAVPLSVYEQDGTDSVENSTTTVDDSTTAVESAVRYSTHEQRGTDFPQTTKEAQRHIKKIQRERMEGCNWRIAEDFENILNLISDDLHPNPMHFILELLQNADDNVYSNSVNPKVWITFSDGTLQFDTNEVGFRRTDVEAICSIGKSSKNSKASEEEVGRIGEKGIGFKTVFKVAEEVFIRSGFYSFKFTNRTSPGTSKIPLGRLAPVWADFPVNSPEGLTSILLKFRKDVDQEKLIEDIKNLDAKFLMFLNRVKEVEIVLSKPHNSFGDNDVILRRQDSTDPSSMFPLRTLTPDNSSPYIVFSYQASNLPYEEKRKGCNKSELVFAFPRTHFMEQQEEPRATPETHKVYSFFPIRDRGFKFVFQADFVLVANREEIDSARPWNIALRDNIPIALLEFVTKLNASNMRYYWPFLFPINTEAESFFQSISSQTTTVFSRSAIIEAAGGEFMLPSELWLVPQAFRDSNMLGAAAEPLIPPGFSKFRYVSSKYPLAAETGLKSLGVKILSTPHFLEDLSNFISEHSEKFQCMPMEWHCQLSSILDRLTADYGELISSFRFIPLRNESWIAPQDGPLLFPLEAGNLVIPEMINCSVIDMSVVEDHTRKTLLCKLGAQNADKEKVCRIIMETHGSNFFNPELVEIDDLIRHAEFLYLAGWQSQEVKDDLWVKLEDGSCCRSSHAYLESAIPYSASQVLAGHRNKFPFLHAKYFTVFNTPKRQKWLSESLKIEIFPRLVIPNDSQESFEISPDFRFLIENIPALEVLQLLKTNWEDYKRWIVPQKLSTGFCEESISEKRHYETIKAVISSMRVNYPDERSAQLNQTYLPRKDILVAFGISGSAGISTSTKLAFEVLPVPDPEFAHWDFLEQFDVVVKVETKHLIHCLQQIKEGSTTKEEVSLLYERIESSASGKNDEFIKREFKEKRLLFIPSSTTHWVGLENCIWNGPNSLRKAHRLKVHYPERELLFRRILGIPSATIKTVITEAKEITTSDSLPYILGLLEELSTRIIKSTLHSMEELESLKTHSIFPIWTGDRSDTFDYLGAASEMAQTNEWYIADSSFLHSCFEGRIPILALDSSKVSKIRPLIEYMGCENRRLSQSAKMESEVEGKAVLDNEYTTSLQGKWKYIASLIPTTTPERLRLSKQLQRVQVFQAQGISVVPKLCTSWGTVVEGCREDSHVVLKVDTDALKIYLKEGKAKIGHPSLQLIEELQGLYGITDNHSKLLYDILLSDNFQEIEDTMSREGLLDNILEFSKANHAVINDLISMKPTTLELTTEQTSSPVVFTGSNVTHDINSNLEPASFSLFKILSRNPLSIFSSATQSIQASASTKLGSSRHTATRHLQDDGPSTSALTNLPSPTVVQGHIPSLKEL